MWNSRSTPSAFYFIALLFSVMAYVAIGYFLPREDFSGLMASFVVAFIGYGYFLRNVQKGFSSTKEYYLGMAFRLIFLLAVPMLSDDFYRFIWDGRLLAAGINPFVHLPDFFLSPKTAIPGIAQNLYDQLNSPQYYSVYPPFCQFVFYITALLSGNDLFQNIIWLRVFILTAEGLTLYFLPKLLEQYHLPKKAGLLYALNPLVIVELSGNLHFEAYMVCFLVLFFYYLKKQQIMLSGVFFGFAVITKLIPLIFLPFLIAPLGIQKAFKFFAALLLVIVAAFLPFSAGFSGLGTSMSLYFQKFEFNASIYFLLREVGFWIAGFNLIYWLGKILAVLVFLLIVRYAWKVRKKVAPNLPQYFMWALMIYLIFATTVHPWYIVPLILFSVFTPFRFPVIWSGLILLTYSQYKTTGFQENLAIVSIEYFLLFLCLWFEVSFQKLKSLN